MSKILMLGIALLLFTGMVSAFSWANIYAGGNGFSGGFGERQVTQTEYYEILTSNPNYRQYLQDLHSVIEITNNEQRVD